MKSIARFAFLPLALAVFNACDTSGPQGSSPEGNGNEATDDSAPGAAIPLTEKRLQAYIAYRKDFHGIIKEYMEEWGKLAKKVDEKSNQLTKTVAATQGLTQIMEKQDTALKALRKKHGFEEGEDERLWAAIGDVVAAKAIENPMLEPQVKIFREMQTKSGEQKQAGDEFFKNLETTEKEGMEKAREQYGSECVDILSKHVKELGALQMDGIQQMTGALAPGK